MTTENNKLLAEFLGRKGKVNKILYSFKNLDYNGQIWFNENELRFNLDWNWLIEVVEKIESLDSGTYTLVFQQKSCLIWNNDKGEELEFFNSSFKAETKIEAVYNAVVAFIEWYNKNAVKS